MRSVAHGLPGACLDGHDRADLSWVTHHDQLVEGVRRAGEVGVRGLPRLVRNENASLRVACGDQRSDRLHAHVGTVSLTLGHDARETFRQVGGHVRTGYLHSRVPGVVVAEDTVNTHGNVCPRPIRGGGDCHGLTESGDENSRQLRQKGRLPTARRRRNDGHRTSAPHFEQSSGQCRSRFNVHSCHLRSSSMSGGMVPRSDHGWGARSIHFPLGPRPWGT